MPDIKVILPNDENQQLEFSSDGFPIDRSGKSDTDNTMLVRSNSMIRAPYSATLLTSKLLALGLIELQKEMKYKQKDSLWVRFPVKRIADELNYKNAPYLYKKLKDISENIFNTWYYVEDVENKSFHSSVIVTDIEYIRGVFSMKFNESVKKHIASLTGDFTPMRKSILMAFDNNKKGNSAYRLYELLNTYTYRINKENPYVFLKFRYSELVILLGLIDLNDKTIKKAMEKNLDEDNIVYDIAKYNTTFYDFDRRVLKEAREEINRITDIKIDYKPERKGKGGKIVSIIFRIEKNDKFKKNIEKIKKKKVIPEPSLDMIIALESIIDVSLSTPDKIKILKAAENDLDRVEKAYKLAKKQAYISNLTAWMTKALDEGWESNEPVQMVKGYSYDETVSFISQRASDEKESDKEDDWEEINTATYLVEKKLLESNSEDMQSALSEEWNKLTGAYSDK